MAGTYTANQKKSLEGREVVTRAIHFFTDDRWQLKSQTDHTITFPGNAPTPWFLIIMTVIGYLFFILPGLIMTYMIRAKLRKFQNIVLSVSPADGGTNVSATCSKKANGIVRKFLATLPA